MFKITFSDIEQLTDVQLTEVLKYLLYAEASRHQLYSRWREINNATKSLHLNF